MAADVKTHLYEWSTTEGSNLPIGSTVVSTNLDDNLRMIQKVVRDLSAPTTLAAGATTDLGSKDETFITLTGTAATITALGTVSAGIYKWVVANAAHVFTHNGTSLILPAAANITAASGDVGLFVSLGSGNWKCLSYTKAAGGFLGALSVADGSVTAPGVNFVTDTNTGMYLAGADTLALASGGSQVARFTATNTLLPGIVQFTGAVTAGAGFTGEGGAISLASGANALSIAGHTTSGGVLAITADYTRLSTSTAKHVQLGAKTSGGDVRFIEVDSGNTALKFSGTTMQLSVVEQAGTPTVTSGAGTSPTIRGTDNAFRVTLGTGPGTALVMAFAATWAEAPIVIAQYQNSLIACRAVSSTTAVTITFASTPADGSIVDVMCMGYAAS